MNTKFNWKDFIIYGFVFSIIFVIFSGIVLYISPNSEFAKLQDWQIFGLTKSIWRSIFISFNLVLIILAILYVSKVDKEFFGKYFNKEKFKKLSESKELFSSIAIVIIVFSISVLEIPPISSISYLSETFEIGWKNKNQGEPVKLSNSMTIGEVAKLFPNISNFDIINKLQVSGLSVKDKNQSLTELSKKNNFPVNEIKRIIISMSEIRTPLKTKEFSKISIADYSIRNGLEGEKVIDFLKENDIIIDSKLETMSEISERNYISQAELQTLLSKLENNHSVGNSANKQQNKVFPNQNYNKMTLKEFSNSLQIDTTSIIAILKKNNMSYESKQTIEEIALANDISAYEIVQLIDTNNQSSQIPIEQLSNAIQNFNLNEVVNKFRENGYDVNIDMIMNRIMQNGISVSGSNQSLKEIAEDNNLTPVQLLDMISGKAGVPEKSDKASGKRKKGVGSVNKKLKELPLQYGVKIETIIERLNAKGITADEEMTIREISINANVSPKEIVDIIKDRKPKK